MDESESDGDSSALGALLKDGIEARSSRAEPDFGAVYAIRRRQAGRARAAWAGIAAAVGVFLAIVPVFRSGRDYTEIARFGKSVLPERSGWSISEAVFIYGDDLPRYRSERREAEFLDEVLNEVATLYEEN
jgi:hypothetical protein